MLPPSHRGTVTFLRHVLLEVVSNLSPFSGTTIPRHLTPQSPSHLPRRPSLLQSLQGRARLIATTLISSRGQRPRRFPATRPSTLPSIRRATCQRTQGTLPGSRASPRATADRAPSARARPPPWATTRPSIAALPRAASATRRPRGTPTPTSPDTPRATRRGTRTTHQAILGRLRRRVRKAPSSALGTLPRGEAAALRGRPGRRRVPATASRRRFSKTRLQETAHLIPVRLVHRQRRGITRREGKSLARFNLFVYDLFIKCQFRYLWYGYSSGNNSSGGNTPQSAHENSNSPARVYPTHYADIVAPPAGSYSNPGTPASPATTPTHQAGPDEGGGGGSDSPRE